MNNKIKPYTIAMVGDNDAEISLYGEVVEQHPVDWWTGEKVPGNFIALDEFLKDLSELETKDNVTVHINSVGGSLYAGLAIYNRLKSLSANITTINDSLAASAASIIFQAGNTRKVHAGSNLMIHEAAGFLYGYYQAADLKSVLNQLDAHNRTAIAAYAEATGRDDESIKKMMAKETWLTGQEAVDAGFADEVITDATEVSMSVTPDNRFIVSNGIAMSTRGLGVLPKNITTMTAAQAAFFMGKNSVSPAQQQEDIKNQTGGINQMDIKTCEDLRKAFPDLVTQIENNAKAAGNAEGVASERARIQGIENIQAAIADTALVQNAKYGDTPLSAEQLALKAMQAQAAIGATMVTKMEEDAKNSKADEVATLPAAGENNNEAKEQEAISMIAGFRPKNKGV